MQCCTYYILDHMCSLCSQMFDYIVHIDNMFNFDSLNGYTQCTEGTRSSYTSTRGIKKVIRDTCLTIVS